MHSRMGSAQPVYSTLWGVPVGQAHLPHVCGCAAARRGSGGGTAMLHCTLSICCRWSSRSCERLRSQKWSMARIVGLRFRRVNSSIEHNQCDHPMCRASQGRQPRKSRSTSAARRPQSSTEPSPGPSSACRSGSAFEVPPRASALAGGLMAESWWPDVISPRSTSRWRCARSEYAWGLSGQAHLSFRHGPNSQTQRCQSLNSRIWAVGGESAGECVWLWLGAGG